MSGIYIKGVKMPVGEDEGILIAIYDGKAHEIGTKKTLDAIELPPHGRLIDADALLNLLNHCMFPSDMVTTTALSMAVNWIKDAPTIIGAEEAGGCD